MFASGAVLPYFFPVDIHPSAAKEWGGPGAEASKFTPTASSRPPLPVRVHGQCSWPFGYF